MLNIIYNQNGGSPITSYNLQYDQGGGQINLPNNFVSLVGEFPDNNLAITQMTLTGLYTN